MNRHANTANDTFPWRTKLDPAALPARYSAPIAGTTSDDPASVTITPNSVAIEGRLASGLPVSVSVPMGMFRGVAVRMVPVEEDEIRITLEILHADPALSVPLAVVGQPEEVIADWQAWANALRLPLLVVAADGSVVDPLRRKTRLALAQPKPRRHHGFFADRRPRFLARRKVGRPMPRLGSEDPVRE